jgi:hypothetical protein
MEVQAQPWLQSTQKLGLSTLSCHSWDVRPCSLIGLTALALIVGTLAIGRGVLIPMVEGRPDLLDANLAKALAEPIHTRIADVLGCAAVALSFAARWATTLALLLLGFSAWYRIHVVPSLYVAWSHVDLLAGRPTERLHAADALVEYELVALAAMMTCAAILLGYAGITATTRTANACDTTHRGAIQSPRFHANKPIASASS